MTIGLADSFDAGRPLAEAIAVATRATHTKLNKLIIARLPHALPPRASDPSVYTAGLLHIAPIYMTFEALWQNIIDSPRTTSPDGTIADGCEPVVPLLDRGGILWPNHDGPKTQQPLARDRIGLMLERMHLPDLMRKNRLKADIQNLTGWPDHVLEEQLKAVSQNGPLGEFLSHIKKAVESKPHVLLAYSYIMFMALFAGGRFIRASLESVGDQFWDQALSPVKPTLRASEPNRATTGEPTSQMSDDPVSHARHGTHTKRTMPLRFFHFPTPMDGEDLKREFKKRLADSEGILTQRERHDVVHESVCIFDYMLLLVAQLDMVFADSDVNAVESSGNVRPLVNHLKHSLGSRLRDSVSVAKERSVKASSKKTASNDEGSNHISAQRRGTQSHSITSAPDESTHATPDQNQSTDDVPMSAGVGLCPGLPKSMRFENALPQPGRGHPTSHDASGELSGSLRMVSKQLHAVHVTNWVLMAAFGAVIISVMLSGR